MWFWVGKIAAISPAFLMNGKKASSLRAQRAKGKGQRAKGKGQKFSLLFAACTLPLAFCHL
jgi:hypothetical protein